MQTETQLQNDDLTEASHSQPRQLMSRRQQFISLVTRYLAAQIILQSDFPNRANMPRISAPEFSNLGHQIFVDYNALVNAVWKTALDVKSAVSEYSKIRKIWAILVVIAIVSGAFLFSVAPIHIGAVYIVLFIAYFFVRKQRAAAKKAAAKIRSEAVTRLLLEPNIKTDPVVYASSVGDGALGGENIPILISIYPSRPFPGYGKLLFENQFICRPKMNADDDSSAATYEQTIKTIQDKLTHHFSSGWSDVCFGDVVVVSGTNLQSDSAWLDKNKAPHLWLPRSALTHLSAIDPRASSRQFFAIQIPLYEAGTIATFFTRLFMAGNSIAYDVSLLTLGPPMVSMESLHTSLKKQKNSAFKEGFLRSLAEGIRWFADSWGRGPSHQEAIEHLDLISNAGAFKKGFQEEIVLGDIRWLDPELETERGAEHIEKSKQISSKSQIWPLRYHPSFSEWRESNSFALPTGSFIRPEALAAVKTAYDQVVRIALESLDNCGYDISDYRDKDGRFTIKAEQIEQLIVGENIKIKTSDKSPKSSEKPSQ